METNNVRVAENGRREATDQKIIVIGASSGGFELYKKLVSNLPPDFQIPIFIVWHMSADTIGILPDVLNKVNSIYAAHAYDHEPILPNRIYVAPPDKHLLIEQGMVRVTRGPKENRFRPAVDPLFRSAAYSYREQVIGVVLSGALDDGTAGLWAIKHFNGIAIVQDPNDAQVPSMPESALREVTIDHCVPMDELAPLLVRLGNEPSQEKAEMPENDERIKREVGIAAEDSAFELDIYQFGELSAFSCPECHGVLSKLKEGKNIRFRCHTGHAYSFDSLLESVSEGIESSLYNAIRGIEEHIMLLNHIGDHFAENNQPRIAGRYFKKAAEAEKRVQVVRSALLLYEQANTGILQTGSKTLDAGTAGEV